MLETVSCRQTTGKHVLNNSSQIVRCIRSFEINFRKSMPKHTQFKLTIQCSQIILRVCLKLRLSTNNQSLVRLGDAKSRSKPTCQEQTQSNHLRFCQLISIQLWILCLPPGTREGNWLKESTSRPSPQRHRGYVGKDVAILPQRVLPSPWIHDNYFLKLMYVAYFGLD